jgi:hypothetical protein
MSKAEEFIKKQSHIIENPTSVWISSYNARKAVEIAREEIVNEVCDYIKNNLYKHLYVCDGEAGFPTAQFINDLKQAMKDE